LAQVDPVGLAVDGVIHEPLRQQDAPSVGGAFRHGALEHLHEGLGGQVLVQRKTSEGHERRANKDACLEATQNTYAHDKIDTLSLKKSFHILSQEDFLICITASLANAYLSSVTLRSSMAISSVV
jgi:hypothetical protein